jgi:chromosome segregation ATPase
MFDELSLSGADDEPSPKHLQDLVEQLRKENASLRAQFDEITTISSELDRLHSENSKLSAQVRTLKVEKEDMTHRLDISMQTSRELNEKLTDQKRTFSEQLSADHSKFKQKVDAIKEKHQRKLDALNAQLAQQQADREDIAVAHAMLANKADQLIQAGQRFFRARIPDLDGLLARLGQPPTPDRPQDAPSPTPAPPPRSARRLKAKIRDLRSGLADGRAALQKSQRDLHDLFRQNEVLHGRLTSLSNEKSDLEAHDRSVIAGLEHKIESLKAQAKQPRPDPSPAANTGAAAPPPNPAPVPRANDLQASINGLSAQNSELADRLQAAERKAHSASERAKQADAEVERLGIELERLRGEAQSLRILNEAAQSDIATLRAAVPGPRPSIPDPPPKKPDRTPNLLKEIDGLRSQAFGLQAELERARRAGDDAQRRIRDLEGEIDDRDQKIEKLAGDIREIRLQKARPVPSVDDLLPPETYMSSEIDPAVAANLEKIARNTALQPASKVLGCYRVLGGYYEGQIEAESKKLQKVLSEFQFAKTSMNQFLIDLSIILMGRAISFDDFMTRNEGRTITTTVAQLKTERDDLAHEVDELKAALQHFNDAFDSMDADEIRAQMDRLIHKAVQQRKRLKVLKNHLAARQRELSENAEEFRLREDEVRFQREQCEAKISELGENLSKLRAENDELLGHLSAEKSDTSELRQALTSDRDQEISSLQNEHQRIQAELRAEVAALRESIARLTEDYNEADAQLGRYRKAFQAQKSANKRQEEEISRLRVELSEVEKGAQERYETEKAQLSKTFEATIAKLGEQSERHLQDIQKLAAAHSDSKAKSAQLRAAAQQLGKERQRLEAALRLAGEQSEREKRLVETAARSRTLALDAEYKDRIEEIKATAENEKRRIFAIVAESFPTYFDLCAEIHERSFKQGIEKIRDDIVRMAAAEQEIRHMLAAGDGQTPQDAVARYMLEKE